MTIKFENNDDFLDFYKKNTKDATIFYFDHTDITKNGFMVCDSRYIIIYQCQNKSDRDYIVDFFNEHKSYTIIYNQDLPIPNYTI